MALALLRSEFDFTVNSNIACCPFSKNPPKSLMNLQADKMNTGPSLLIDVGCYGKLAFAHCYS